MDAFGDNFVPEGDPAAEFLAREQDELAGLEDEIPPVTSFTPAVNEDAILNENNFKASVDGDTEASFEIINSDTQSQPEPYVPAPVREEPEKMRKWREDQKTRLEEKDKAEEKKKEEWQEAARKELEEWYKHHSETIAKTKATNRNAEKQFVAEAEEVEPGTEWERIAKICDFNPKSSRTSKDVSRMRSIILQLKQSPPPTVNAN